MRRTHLLPLVLSLISAANAWALESGKPIAVGGAGAGPLATFGVVSLPVGAARVSGAEEPDLFVATTKFGLEQGLFLYKWAGRGDNGEPMFHSPTPVKHPFDAAYPPPGRIVQLQDGSVHGLWMEEGNVVHTVFNASPEPAFELKNRIPLTGLPRRPGTLGVLPHADGTVDVLLEIGDGTSYSPPGPGGRDPDYVPYDGRGIWRGGLPRVGLYAVTLPRGFDGPAEDARLVSASEKEALLGYGGITVLDLDAEHGHGILTGSRFGNFYYYGNKDAHGLALAPARLAAGGDGVALRHPTIGATPVAYPRTPGLWPDIIAGGEGGLYWYRFRGEFAATGAPVFDDPLPVLEERACLYAGSLPVVNVVDWDGDGDKDLVAGNSEGLILFFENHGSDSEPQFKPGVPLQAGGMKIHVQPGYRQDIQGPGEARWGYVCPTVCDWNQDGQPDIVMSDSTARHTVFLNEGTKTAPRLAAGQPLFCDGLDLFGTWRVQPAVGIVGGRMAYIALDADDEVHLYWQVDPRNVTDGCKLRLDTGEPIRANYLSAGGTGRLKLVLTDWNGDALPDLIIGTPRHASVPNPTMGLPQSLGKPGSAVLYLQNVGTKELPAFAFPKVFAYMGEPRYFGQHACSPAVAPFDGAGEPGLIVGEESGRFFYFSRKDIGFVEAQ